MRIVMDTDVLVTAFRSPRGASREIVRLLYEGMIEGAASVALMLEYEEVLLRPEQRAVTGLDVGEVHTILDQLAAVLHPVMTHFLWRSFLRDPNDELVLEAAINGRADALVTFNVSDYFPAAQYFRLEVLRPVELQGDCNGTDKQRCPTTTYLAQSRSGASGKRRRHES